jgi:hypothetical protein
MRLLDVLFDNEYKQRRDLGNLEEASAQTTDVVGQLQSEVSALRHRLDRVELAAEAMDRLLQEKGMVTADELRTQVARVDLEDGKEDGVIGEDHTATAPACPTCARPANFRRRTTCVYCGAPLKPARAQTPYR